MSSTTPPPAPWVPDATDYRLLRLLVKVAATNQGWVFSEHDFATPEDALTAFHLPGHGLKQIAYALTTEALRRETFLCLLAELSKHPDVLKGYRQGDADYQKRFADRLSGATLATVMGLTQKMLPEIAREVIEMALFQAGDKGNNSE